MCIPRSFRIDQVQSVRQKMSQLCSYLFQVFEDALFLLDLTDFGFATYDTFFYFGMFFFFLHLLSNHFGAPCPALLVTKLD